MVKTKDSDMTYGIVLEETGETLWFDNEQELEDFEDDFYGVGDTLS